MDQSDKEQTMTKVNSPNLTNPDYVYPRTLEEAFGSRGPVIDPEDPPMDWQDKAVLWAAPAAVIFLIVLLAFES